jgi:uncharacterized protein YqeY
MALTAIRAEEVSGPVARELGDDEVVTVLNREAKKRREAASAFDGAGRAEQAQRELDELGVLQAYLPAQFTDEELAAIVTEAVAGSGVTGMAAMGPIMKAVQVRVVGRAEGGRVAAEVRRQLAG